MVTCSKRKKSVARFLVLKGLLGAVMPRLSLYAGVACEEGAEQLCQCLCAMGSVVGCKGLVRGGEVYGGMMGWYIGQPFGVFF